jgi:hypothetical protein
MKISVLLLTMVFIGVMFYIADISNKEREHRKELYSLKCFNPEDFFTDTSYQYLEGYRLDIPNEISTLSHYDDREFDLLVAYVDDGGDIHLGFTGKTIKREEYLNGRDSLHFIEEHSQLAGSVND